MRRNRASSASRIARLFSTSASMTTRGRVQLESGDRAQQVQWPVPVRGIRWTHQRMRAGLVLAGGVVVGERVKVGAGELAVTQRDAVQLAQVRGGMRAAVLSAQVGRDLDPGPRRPPRSGPHPGLVKRASPRRGIREKHAT